MRIYQYYKPPCINATVLGTLITGGIILQFSHTTRHKMTIKMNPRLLLPCLFLVLLATSTQGYLQLRGLHHHPDDRRRAQEGMMMRQGRSHHYKNHGTTAARSSTTDASTTSEIEPIIMTGTKSPTPTRTPIVLIKDMEKDCFTCSHPSVTEDQVDNEVLEAVMLIHDEAAAARDHHQDSPSQHETVKPTSPTGGRKRRSGPKQG